MIQLYCMNYVTTNIRLPEEDYLRLKTEAAQHRMSLSAVIRKKITTSYQPLRSPEQVKRMMMELEKLAKENAKVLKGTDAVTIIREMRNQTQW